MERPHESTHGAATPSFDSHLTDGHYEDPELLESRPMDLRLLPCHGDQEGLRTAKSTQIDR